MSIRILNISKSYGNFAAVRDVSFRVESGELMALLGPSGSGKTTLLRIIAGLEQADTGTVLLHDADATNQSAAARRVGFVFQHYALFRHLTVFENVAFGLRVQSRNVRPSRGQIRERVHELLRLVQLESHANMYPSQLSGGQRQRVALARALAVKPQVLLLDEPFGALDANVRKELRRWLRRLHDELHVTSVFVTHDQEEALEVADRIAVLNAGAIEQIGTPEEVYDHPVNPFVYRFLGNVNLFRRRGGVVFSVTGRQSHAGTSEPEVSPLGYVRPYELEIERSRVDESAIEAEVINISSSGRSVRIELKQSATGEPIEVEISRERQQELTLKAGDTVFVKAPVVRLFGEADNSQVRWSDWVI